ncbi:hypothetical protein BDV33DRAFT_176025 [Aspergillus novoparasiticus]|uniref:Uncharacterized protein n=1 Tax=Aspergillus novoparasiticus TaxID=986946 RepID=A0A5N6EL91_9EURO|nr:hypothetical protein BDV33DRAFT_176025 [Aspergillus novoparasiticus]
MQARLDRLLTVLVGRMHSSLPAQASSMLPMQALSHSGDQRPCRATADRPVGLFVMKAFPHRSWTQELRTQPSPAAVDQDLRLAKLLATHCAFNDVKTQ